MLIKSGDHDDQSHSKEMKALEGQDQDELGSKEIFELVESKVKAHFSTRRETDLAEMMQKLRYLQASNDQLEARADSLLRKVAEVTLLPQKRDKKASTAALKIEAGEVVETAINQMKQEKEQLRERVTALEGTLQSLTDESTKAVDELYKQLNEVKGQLETSDMKCDKLQTRVSKKKEKLAAKSLKIQKLKTSLTAKNELLLASEAEKTSQRADLEDHIMTAQNSLEEKKEEISKLQKQLEQSFQKKLDTEKMEHRIGSDRDSDRWKDSRETDGQEREEDELWISILGQRIEADSKNKLRRTHIIFEDGQANGSILKLMERSWSVKNVYKCDLKRFGGNKAVTLGG